MLMLYIRTSEDDLVVRLSAHAVEDGGIPAEVVDMPVGLRFKEKDLLQEHGKVEVREICEEYGILPEFDLPGAMREEDEDGNEI